MPDKPINLQTIAKMAHVSKVTVSNVVNGKYDKASKETIERIQKIIEVTGYRPSATARSLSMKQSRIIGVVIPYLYANESFSGRPYNAHMLGHLERYIRNQGYYMMPRCVMQSFDALPDFATWNVDGAFVLDLVAEDALRLQDKLNIPAVFIDTYTNYAPLATVCIDDYKGGYLAGKYLLDKGHRRIAFVSPTLTEHSGVMQERYRGFCDALRERGAAFAPEQHIVTESVLYDQGVEAGKQIAASNLKFTAVAAMADVLAFGVMDGLRQGGKQVPDDVSVVGFDDLPECQYTYPQLTSVSQHLEEKAQCAGEYLFSMLRDGNAVTGSRKVDVDLIERQSVKAIEAPAADEKGPSEKQ
ncbi:MAG: LacI family DNA-binding transcriptional regulator [Christensenellaceae bacterium]|nr:LacI family DNA-binding transcriptional regulator [Christensenellaceae bacterium]